MNIQRVINTINALEAIAIDLRKTKKTAERDWKLEEIDNAILIINSITVGRMG